MTEMLESGDPTGQVHKPRGPPVMSPFFSCGSCQLTLSDVSRISVKLRCPTAPGAVEGVAEEDYCAPLRSLHWPHSSHTE